MDMMFGLQQFSPLDAAGAVMLLVAWLGIGMWIENSSGNYPSVSRLMTGYRRDWLRHHITREPRVFDAMVLANLRNGTTFFASGCMLAIGGTLALLGNLDPIEGLARDLALQNVHRAVIETKLIVLMLMLAKAFFNFVWSHRVFGYSSVLMGAIPNDPKDANAQLRADQAAELNILAARSFNRGLRTIYFALACLAWVLGPWALIIATLATFLVVWRREFSSHSRKVLLNKPPAP
ncbi:membrane protein [Actibacterium mucosum KCTC 23349]|uniref:Membrane protein n=1 Tax=Actibacterium mucosum KCTC 23349 TaxID=1454373 RepID=A0A037ZGA5_9RHOB|nr:DUF599 domain-containing protein [Actibacterium mucosum]KAJ54653.1 membrane protein [Actibacterium mucosum KCTC 23349]